MLSRDDLEKVSRLVDGEPAQGELTPEMAAARAEMEAVLAASADLPVELAAAHAERLVQRVLATPARQPLRRGVRLAVLAAAVLAVVATAALLQHPRSVATIADLDGPVALNGRAVAEADAVPPGAAIETGGDATVRLHRENEDLVLAPNTRVVMGEVPEVRAGVVWVQGDAVTLLAGASETQTHGGVFVVVEPSDTLDRVTARLTSQPNDSEHAMRPLLLSLALPAVAFAASTSPAIVARDGSATLTQQGVPHEVKTGGQWAAETSARPADTSNTAALEAKIASLSTEQAALRQRIEALERAGNKNRAPATAGFAPVKGIVFDTLGRTAANVTVMRVAGDEQPEVVNSDADGHFSIETASGAEGVVYAYKDSRVALVSGARPGADVVLKLREPGKINVRVLFNGAPLSGTIVVGTTAAGIGAVLPDMYAGSTYKGDAAIQLRRPAGDLMLFARKDSEAGSPVLRGLTFVHLEPGGEANVTVELHTCDAAVRGHVVDAVTHKVVKGFEVTMLYGDDSLEQSYRSDPADFGFNARSPGERFIVISADGYKPLRTHVVLESQKTTELGSLALQPL